MSYQEYKEVVEGETRHPPTCSVQPVETPGGCRALFCLRVHEGARQKYDL